MIPPSTAPALFARRAILGIVGVGLALLALVALLSLVGCAVGKTGAGQDLIGIPVDTANAAATGFLPALLGDNPLAGLAGLLGVLGVGAAAHYRGTRVGWDEAVGTPATPAKPAQATSLVSPPDTANPYRSSP